MSFPLLPFFLGLTLGAVVVVTAIKVLNNRQQAISYRIHDNRNNYSTWREDDWRMEEKSMPKTPTKPIKMKDDDDICPICLEILKDDKFERLSCGHGFHNKCGEDLRRNAINECPKCRKEF